MPGSRPEGDERGSAVVDFVLILVILVPLFLAVMQVALVHYVKNTLTAAASEGARYGATIEHTPEDGAARTRQLVSGTLSGRYAGNVSAHSGIVGGAQTVVVRIKASVPPLGMWGPRISMTAEGHAIQEPRP
jgi:Flp pilus assembly protein TadG